MAQKSIYALSLDIIANSAKLNTELQKANSSIDKTGKKATGLGTILKNTFKEVGGYINSVIPGFTTFTSKIGDTAKAVTSFSGTLKALKIVLASNIFGLLVVALGTLISYFKNTDAGADKFAKALNAIKGIISAVTQRISLLGEAVVLLLKGDFKGAAEKAKAAFADLGDTLKSTWQKGLELGERKNKLEDDQIALIRKKADFEREISELELIAYDKSKDAKTRIDALNKSIALRKDLAQEEVRLAEENYNILTQQNALGDNLDKDNKAEAEAYAEMVSKRTALNDEIRATLKLQNTLRKELAEQAKEQEALNLANMKASNVIPKVDTSNLTIPNLAPTVDTTSLVSASIQTATLTDAYKQLFEQLDLFQNIPDPFQFLVASANKLQETLSEGAKTFKEYGKTILSTIKNIISGYLAQAVAAAILKAFEGVKGLAGLIAAPFLAAAGAGAVKTLFNTLIPGFASGTNFAPGGLALVGERGPEIANLPRGTKVYNNGLTNSMLSRNLVLTHRLEGRDILFVVQEAENVKSNSY